MAPTTNVVLDRFGVVSSDLPDQRGVRSVPFEAHLCLVEQFQYEQLTHLAERLLQSGLEKFQRKPNATRQRQLAANIGLILLNLVRAEALSGGMAVGIGTSKQRLAASRRYNPPFMTVDYFLKARDLLQERGVMFIAAPGYQNSGLAQVARYRLTDNARALICPGAPSPSSFQVSGDKETIRLKDASGYLTSYKDDMQTTAMRDGLRRINQILKTTSIGSARPPLPASDFEEGHEPVSAPLYRVFNNGTFEQGGRFYGGWWQNAKRHFRPMITLNHETTIEADFKGLHPAILFARQRLSIPVDPYSLVEGVEGDPTLRDFAKTTFMALLNAGKGCTEEPRNFDSHRYQMTGKQFRAKVKAAFPMLPGIFGSGIGVHLQREDSDIAELVMLHFVDQGIPILPIHDSFIVAQRHRDELVQVMQDRFREIYGQSIAITVKGLGIS